MPARQDGAAARGDHGAKPGERRSGPDGRLLAPGTGVRCVADGGFT
jgi:hypothetical protein